MRVSETHKGVILTSPHLDTPHCCC